MVVNQLKSTYTFQISGFRYVNLLPYTVELTEVLRQKDPRLVAALNEVRVGDVSPVRDNIGTNSPDYAV